VTAGSGPGTSPRCGATYAPAQEYCLECGARLPVAGTLGAGVAGVGRHVPWTPRPWLWPVVAGLVIAAVMTGLAILIARSGEPEETGFLVATTGGGVAAPTIETTPTDETTTETETAATTTAPTTTERPELVEWPPSQSGYTVVIASIPTGQGRATAIRKARQVLRNGLPDVGVIESADFSSLHPGYYVVFSGIYANQRAAFRAAGRVDDLYPLAYIRQISR
jgi:hypothetical protein